MTGAALATGSSKSVTPSTNVSAGMSRVGQYRHLDNDSPIRVKEGSLEVHLTAAAIIEAARNANYGVHRLLSELVTQSAEDARRSGAEETPLMAAIREQLEAGEHR